MLHVGTHGHFSNLQENKINIHIQIIVARGTGEVILVSSPPVVKPPGPLFSFFFPAAYFNL